VSWDNPTDRVVVGPELLKEMEEQMIKIKQNLKAAQDRHKSYADSNRTHREFKVGDHVFLKVKTNRSSLKLVSCAKLAARFCGQFEILERIGPVAYMLALPASMTVHNVFHVSILKKYVPDTNHVIDWTVIKVETRRCPASASCTHIGQEKKTASESSYRACKGPMDLVWS
jgi:hypothetical protein